MSAERNLRLFVPYLVCSVEGVLHGVYLLWLTLHKGLTPLVVSVMIAARLARYPTYSKATTTNRIRPLAYSSQS